MAHLLLRAQVIQSLICFMLFVNPTSQASAPTITSAPNSLYQRQENEGPKFLGYQTLKDGRYDTESCDDSSTYFTSSRWAACVTDDSDLYTGCTNTSVALAPTRKATCGQSKTCGSALIYNNPTDAALSYVGCFGGSLRPTYYRQKLTSSTTITTTLATTMTSSASTEARAGPISTSTSSTVSPSPTEAPASQNLAWVAGPVVGGIAGIAIIALLVWIVLLLRKKQSHEPTPENQFIQPDFAAKPQYQAQMYPSPVPEQPPRVMSMGPSPYPSAPRYELEPITYHGPRPGA